MNETPKSMRGGYRPGAGRKPGHGLYGEPTVPVRIPVSQAEMVRSWLQESQRSNATPASVDGDHVELVGPAMLEAPALARPLFLSSVPAGLPSPADDSVEACVDLNAHVIKHPSSTFFVRVQGDSMTGAGIFDRDLLVVDRSLDPVNGSVVIAVIDGELTVKRLELLPNGEVELRPENPDFPIIRLSEFQDLNIWGVVTNVIHSVRP